MNTIIKLDRITITNFRGIKDLSLVFDSDETNVYGANGTGKSTLFSAFVWLLFGKDAEDRKDFSIKRIENGKVLAKTDATVEAMLNVNGQSVTLKRAFVEEWVKPRGTTEHVFKGNKTEYWYNDVPMTMREYTAKISSLIDDGIFKLITNPHYFSALSWQQQREYLFSLIDLKEEDLIAKEERFRELIARIGNKSLLEYRKELSSRKRKLKDALSGIQPRVDQTRKLMPESCDQVALMKELKSLEKDIEEVDSQLTDENKRLEDVEKKYSLMHKKLRVEQRFKEEYISDIEQKLLLHKRELGAIGERIYGVQRDIDGFDTQLVNLEGSHTKLLAEINELRRQWAAKNSELFCDSIVCSNCKQELPIAMREQASAIFQDRKAEELKRIERSGAELNDKKRDLEELTEMVRGKRAAKIEELAAVQKERDALGVAPALDPKKIEEFDDLIEAHKRAISNASKGEALWQGEAITAKKGALNTRRDALKAAIAEQDQRAKFLHEISKIESEGRDLANQIAKLEQDEDTAEAIVVTKAKESEMRINALFGHVRFQLFDKTQDGNTFETCVPVINGVPYGCANNASQINAGLDIINTFCRHYHITAPIFIDGRESVNELIKMESQIINLIVSTDKEIIIK